MSVLLWSFSIALCLALSLLPDRAGSSLDSDAASPAFASYAAEPDAQASERDADDPLRRLVIDDEPQPLVPRHPRTEAEEDRLEAIALYAAGCTLQQRAEEEDSASHRRVLYVRALRHLQRAFRRDPKAAAAGRATVAIAADKLEQPTVAARYALKLAPEQFENANPLMLRKLGVRLTAKDDFVSAAGLYERALVALKARMGNSAGPAGALLGLELARLLHLSGEHDKAADYFLEVIEALENPKRFQLSDSLKNAMQGEGGLTYQLAGFSLMKAGHSEEAEAAFRKAHDVAPDKGLLHFNLAQVRAQDKKYEQALNELDACFQEHLASEGLAPFELLAEVLQHLGNGTELVGRLEKLRNDDPENVPLAYSLADAYVKTEQFVQAETLLVKLLAEKTPTLTGFRQLIEIYYQAKQWDPLLEMLGRTAELIDRMEGLEDQVAAIAEDADAMHALLDLARHRLKDKEEKRAYGLAFAMALLAMESQQWDTAAEFFDHAISAKPKRAGRLLMLWGVGLLWEEQTVEAAKIFQSGINDQALSEDNPAFYYYLAAALAAEDKTDEALAAARKASELRDDSPLFALREAWVLARAKRHDEAADTYRQIIEQFDSNHDSDDIRDMVREARLMLSSLYVTMERLPEAEEELERILDEFPDDVGASNDLGYLWADQNRHLQRALAMIQLAVHAKPENTAYRDSLGWIYYRLGRFDEAVAELEKAAQRGRDNEPDRVILDPVILDHLGDAYLKAKTPEKARDAWQRSAEAFREREEPEKAKRVQEKITDHS